MLHDTVTLTAASHPFCAGARTVPVVEGMTIAEMLAHAQPDPVLAAHAVAFIDGHMVERRYWHCVRPKAGKTVEIRVLPMGGGGGGGKDVLRTVLSLAVLVAASVVPGLPALGLTTVQQGFLQAGIAVLGNLAVNALIPVQEPDRPAAEDEIFSLEGFRNQARPFEPVPQILGRRRIAPDYGARVFTEIVGRDQYLRAIFVWGIGPLHIDESSLRIGETPITDFEDVEMEHHSGYVRRNLFTEADGLDGGGWSELTNVAAGAGTRYVTPNVATAPDGTTTADKLIESTDNDAQRIFNNSFAADLTEGLEYTYSVYLKAAERSVVQLKTTRTGGPLFDLSAGTYDSLGGMNAAGMIDAGNGWYRCWVTLTRGADPDPPWISLINGGTTLYTGDGTSGVLVWGVQYEPGDLTAYQPVTDGTEFEDAPRTLFSDTVIQQNLQVLLGDNTSTPITGEQIRTAPAEADELSIDITFPGGLLGTGRNTGDRFEVEVGLTILYREVGTATWLVPTFTAKTFPDSWVGSGGQVIFTGARASAVRHGMRWSVPTGQYEIKLERLNTNSSPNQIVDATFWTAIRAIEDRDPIRADVPVATTTVRIRASDQLNGALDEFNGIVTTIGADLQGSAWVDGNQITSPSSLMRHVAQGRANAVPIAEIGLDLPSLEDFHGFCTDKGFECNLVIRNGRSVWDVMAEVAACGRAAPAYVNQGWGVVIDRPQPLPVSHITPRNSAQFEAEKAFSELPHAFRIPFINENESWRQDEKRVYRTGFDETNATRFEELRLPGITNPDQIEKMGRYRMAQAIHQPERWTFRQDMEFLTYQRSDRVKITHDVLLVGLHSGRIKSVTVDGSNNVTGLTFDEEVEMQAGEDYGVSIRTVADAAVSRRVTTVAGLTHSVTLAESIPAIGGAAAIERGDLFGFGLFGLETDDAQIIAIRPNNADASVVAVPYREAIYAGDDEEIPPFQTNLTPLPVLPAPMVRDVISDERMLVLGNDGSLRVRVGFNVDPVPNVAAFTGARLEIQQRRSSTGEPYIAAPVEQRDEGVVIISGGRENETYDFRLRWVPQGGRLPGPWAFVSNHTVVGRSTPPAGLANLTLSAFGGAAYLRWDRPDEIDVRFGGRVQFRHSPLTSGASWGASNSIGDLAQASAQLVVLPLKPGTYLARVIDQSGRTSLTTATVTTKQATVLDFASTDTIDEATAFSGTKTDVTVNSGALRLTDPAVSQTGVYEFAAGLDFGAVVRRRLTSRVALSSFNVSDLIDSRTDFIDSWPNFDGDVPDGGDVIIQARHTDDDPLSTPTWTAWDRLDSAEFEARAFEFRALVSTTSPDVNLTISELGIDADSL